MRSFARVEFGMQAEEFLTLTYRQFDALKARLEEKQRRSDMLNEFMLSQLCAVVNNTAMRQAYGEGVPATHFLPVRGDEAKAVKQKVKRKTKAEIRAEVCERLGATMRHFMGA